MSRRVVLAALAGVVVLVVGGLLLLALSRWTADNPATKAPPNTSAGASAPVRKIQATLFYVAADGSRLVDVEREVAYEPVVSDQAIRIVDELLKPPPSPLLPALPNGTKLRGLYVTDRGEAFVDLSSEASTAHPGGSLGEMFSVYAIVDGLSANLPALTAVQILVDGKEVDTLAGHIDLRRPLKKNLELTAEPEAPAAAQTKQN